MAKIELPGGATVDFEEVDDIQLNVAYHRFNRDAFDSQLSADVKVRWAKIIGLEGNYQNSGLQYDDASSDQRYIFIDQRLKSIFLSFPYLVELVLLHEMCHLRVEGHGPKFLLELLTALERISWSPLIARCAPFSLQEIFSSVNVGASQDDDLPTAAHE